MDFEVEPAEDRLRLDKVLAHRMPQLSRSFLQSLCKKQLVLVNGQAQKSGYMLRWKDTVSIQYDITTIGEVPAISLPVIYEDDDVIVIDKPSGVLSHALTKFKQEPSVASFLRSRLASKHPKDDIRFGMVHRLDRLTSGVMICAKHPGAMSMLQKQFAERSVKKTYHAIVSGTPEPQQAVIDVPLERNPRRPATFRPGSNGKPAQTYYSVIGSSAQWAYIELVPKTGRTHQLRVHMQHIKHPIRGDNLYGGVEADRLYLHAASVAVTLPNGQQRTFQAPTPTSFQDAIQS